MIDMALMGTQGPKVGHFCISSSLDVEIVQQRQIVYTVDQGKITLGLRAISAPKCKKEPLKIAIDCNVKTCSMLQI